MKDSKPPLLTEVSAMARFAFPIVLAQVGTLTMGIVDTVLVGRLGAEALGGVGASRSVFAVSFIFLSGILASLDTLASQAAGSDDRRGLLDLLLQALGFSLFLSLIAVPVVYAAGVWVPGWVMQSALVASASDYLKISALGIPAMLCFVVLQRYWQARGNTVVVLIVVLVANVVNYYANLAWIEGRYGFPALGVAGSAHATNVARVFMLVCMLIFTAHYLMRERLRWSSLIRKAIPNPAIYRGMMRLGLPVGGQLVFETAAFSVTAIFASHLGAVEASAHHIVVMIISFTYMFPLGLGSAAAYRVGFYVGAGNPEQARRSGWIATAVGTVIMTLSSLVLIAAPDLILGWFTQDPQIITMARKVLFWGALFQIADAVQICAAGALRGIGETRSPMIANAIGYYPIGLVGGFVLCFGFGWGLPGIWLGLALGLGYIAVKNLSAWYNASVPPPLALETK